MRALARCAFSRNYFSLIGFGIRSEPAVDTSDVHFTKAVPSSWTLVGFSYSYLKALGVWGWSVGQRPDTSNARPQRHGLDSPQANGFQTFTAEMWLCFRCFWWCFGGILVMFWWCWVVCCCCSGVFSGVVLFVVEFLVAAAHIQKTLHGFIREAHNTKQEAHWRHTDRNKTHSKST